MQGQGTFIVLEGTDGSGKGTQFRLLSARLRAMGYEIAVFDFPRYDQPSSHFVTKYLNGEYGPASSVNPYTASLFYALDRYEAASDIKTALEQGKIVLANRFVGSNMAHQGSKFADKIEQRGFFVWEDNLEYELLSIPRPSLNLFLRVPAEIAYDLISKKAARSYTKESHDEHEKDVDHLKKSVETYDTLCQLFPKDFKAIECAEGDKILSIPEINDRIWTTIKPLLPANPPHPARSMTVSLEDGASVTQKTEEPAEQAKKQKTPAATSNSGGLDYSFDNLSVLAVNALSINGAKISLNNRPWASSKEKPYHTPKLSKETANQYKTSMDKIAGLHAGMFTKLNAHLGKDSASSRKAYEILEAVVPVAAQCSGTLTFTKDSYAAALKISGPAQAELKPMFKELEERAAKLWPEVSAQKTRQDDLAQINKLAEELSANLAAETDEIRILQAWPRQEFELLADALYGHSNLSREDIMSSIEQWPYQRKYQALKLAANDNAANILDLARYRIDAVIDGITLNQLLGSVEIDDLQVQSSTPRYGYEVPAETEAAGIEDDFMECFDESLKIFSLLQESPSPNLAPYGTLIGHKVRAQFTLTADTLRTVSNNPAVAKLMKQVKEATTDFHPILSEVEIKKAAAPKPAAKKPTKRSHSRRSSKSKKS